MKYLLHMCKYQICIYNVYGVYYMSEIDAMLWKRFWKWHIICMVFTMSEIDAISFYLSIFLFFHVKDLDSTRKIFPFKGFLLNSSKNELWTGRSGGRSARRTTNTLSIPSILLIQSFHGWNRYSIYSFAQLSWHNTSEHEFWMVDLGFLLFSFPFLFIVFFFITCNCELWMVRSWFPSFLKVHFHSCCARTAAQNYR